MSRGAFIVLEGVDRCGKSSQTSRLIESLRTKNIKAEQLAFPDRKTNTGHTISEYLKENNCKLNDQAIHLLFSANRWENVEKIEDRLKMGITLIVDRYSYSGVAFSAAKGIDISWCMQPEIGLPKPDLVCLLNINIEEQMKRPGFGSERYENSTFQNQVMKVFLEFAENESNWQIINANRTFDDVHKDLLTNIENTIEKVEKKNLPLQYFTKK